MNMNVIEKQVINAVSVVLCTDESKYIDDDSHYLHIPKSLFVRYINNIDLNNVCFELSNLTDPTKPKIYLKKIEPSLTDFDKNILLPNWVCNKLSIDVYGNKISLVPIIQPNKIKRCKIKANNSSYIKMNIKQLLEDKLVQFKCINIDTTFTINKVIFTIVELITVKNDNVNYGLINDELEIDFDVPDDIKFIERRKLLTEKITKIIEDKINSNNEFKTKFNTKKKGIFKFNEYMETQQKQLNEFNPNMNWDEIHNDLLLELEKNFINEPVELDENKKILCDLINDGKMMQTKFVVDNKNSTGYKLNSSISTNSSALTKDDIRKARLEKINMLNTSNTTNINNNI